ncbi:nucleotidyltransferase domain-containing protein [Kitasatospora sp. NPDC018058]|uniref:nucleotidyltransferase domain-containing protein n=1 Tax=Kitasatospora sp. NPDC018058 TaxID=3364025 RepID=UPI0037BE4FE0
MVNQSDVLEALDLHPVAGSTAEGGYQLLPDGGLFHYPAPVSGTIGGREVLCVDAETQVRCHTGYELREKDRQDMARLRTRTGVELPGQCLASP